MRMIRPARPRAARGFSLIEVMISVLVLSVGLLGLAGLQVVSLKQNHNAYLRTQASHLAYDILERMRANRTAALAGNYDIDFEQAASGTGLVDVDLAQWKTRVAALLPDGDGAVSVGVGDGVAVVTVRWDDARGSGGAENVPDGELLQFRVTTEL